MGESDSQNISHLLQKGTEVEVTSDEEGFRGAWYLATILEPLSSSKKRTNKKGALVQYKTLVAEDGLTPLKEYVDPAFIRPLPPEDPPVLSSVARGLERVFEVNDVVDANYTDGWWTGVVRKVLKGSKYLVCFDNPPDIIEFEGKDLRLHWDWDKGNWVRPGKQQMSESIFSSGTAVEVNVEKGNVHAWFPAVVIKQNEDDTFWVRYQSSRIRGEDETKKVVVDSLHIRPNPPPSVARNFELLEKVDAWTDFGWRAGVITKVIAGGRYNVFFKQGNEDKEFKKSDIRPHAEWIDGRWKSKEVKSCDNQQQLTDAQIEDGMVEVAVKFEGSDAAADNIEHKLPRSLGILTVMGHLDNCNEKATLDDKPRSKKIKLAVLNSNGVPAYSSKKTQTVTPAKGTPDGLVAPNSGGRRRYIRQSMVGNQPYPKVEGQLSGKRPWKVDQSYSRKVDVVTWKGRATRSPFGSSAALAAVEATKAVDSAVQTIREIEDKMDVVEVPVNLGLESQGTGSIVPDNPHQQTADAVPNLMIYQMNNSNVSGGDKSMELRRQGGRSSKKRKRGRPRQFIVQRTMASKAVGSGDLDENEVVKDHPTDGVELSTQIGVECADAPGGKSTEDLRKEDNMAVVGDLTDVADDDQPLSTWFNGLPSSTSVEESRFASGKSTNEAAQTTVRQVAAEVESYATDVERDSVENGDKCLPFVKRSPVWKTIESMEVFQTMPQRPHFLPLVKCKEEYREGSAIGIMVTFASLFDKISSLQIDDPRRIFESVLESLLDLEKHGFDVAIPQGRIDMLLEIKDKGGELLNESLNAERLINEQTRERRALNEKMDEINKKIAELREEYGASESKMQAMDLEMTKLQSTADSAKARIYNARHDFEKLVAAPWRLP